jgi:hypothetical protein
MTLHTTSPKAVPKMTLHTSDNRAAAAVEE